MHNNIDVYLIKDLADTLRQEHATTVHQTINDHSDPNLKTIPKDKESYFNLEIKHGSSSLSQLSNKSTQLALTVHSFSILN